MTKARRKGLLRFIGVAGLTVVLSSVLCAQVVPVTVSQVDPPTWRTDPSPNAMLRLSGQHMDDVVRVAVKHKGVRVLHIEPTDAHHLVVWLRVSSDAVPGAMILQVSTRFMTTFVSVPMFGQTTPSPSGEMTAGR